VLQLGATEEDEEEEEEEEEEEVVVVVVSLSVLRRPENGKQTIVELPEAWSPDW
jgi:hypothetical protein